MYKRQVLESGHGCLRAFIMGTGDAGGGDVGEFPAENIQHELDGIHQVALIPGHDHIIRRGELNHTAGRVAVPAGGGQKGDVDGVPCCFVHRTRGGEAGNLLESTDRCV